MAEPRSKTDRKLYAREENGRFAPVLAVAPMMDWTDRHCRFFHRLLTRRALLYTEMVVADALIHGDVERHLRFDPREHPVALQIGGSDPDKLARAARLGAARGYDEINLNVGCPSDRVQSGTFGACLMRQPDLVAACVGAMKEAVDVPVTVKCRLGVDEQDVEQALDVLADAVLAAECDALWVHARMAWLRGLSPKENRDVPPLNYDRVRRLKARLPDTFVGINGGIADLDEAVRHLDHVDGVMLGRAAYRTPALLQDVDRVIYGEDRSPASDGAVRDAMTRHVRRHVEEGGRVNHVTRHMLGMLAGRPGARRFRRILSEGATRPGADAGVIADAFAVAVPFPDAAPVVNPNRQTDLGLLAVTVD